MIIVLFYLLGFILTAISCAIDDDLGYSDGEFVIRIGVCVFWPITWSVFTLALITVIPYEIGRSWLDKTHPYPNALKGEEVLAKDLYGNKYKGIYLGGSNIAVVYGTTKIDPSTIRITNRHRITKLGKLLYKKNKP